MSDPQRKMIEVAVLPAGDVYIDANSPDMIALMLRDADRRISAEHAATAKRLAAEIDDVERTRRTKRARVVRHFRRALSALLRA